MYGWDNLSAWPALSHKCDAGKTGIWMNGYIGIGGKRSAFKSPVDILRHERRLMQGSCGCVLQCHAHHSRAVNNSAMRQDMFLPNRTASETLDYFCSEVTTHHLCLGTGLRSKWAVEYAYLRTSSILRLDRIFKLMAILR
jgi:hypothetical protein